MRFRTAMILTLPLVAALALASCDSKKPAPAGGPAAKTAGKSTATPAAADWCGEHGVPESACTKCHPNLIADFKQKGDWCKEHGLPESHCIQCDPTLKEKLAAMAPKDGK